MSLTAVRPYFRARLNSLGYREWDDAFYADNIPENIIDKAYHIDANEISRTSFSQTDLQLEHVVTTRLFFTGFFKPKDALDKTMERLDAILKEVLKPSNRLSGTSGLRNVDLQGVTIEPLSDSNDNTLLVSLTWNVQINLCTT